MKFQKLKRLLIITTVEDVYCHSLESVFCVFCIEIYLKYLQKLSNQLKKYTQNTYAQLSEL